MGWLAALHVDFSKEMARWCRECHLDEPNVNKDEIRMEMYDIHRGLVACRESAPPEENEEASDSHRRQWR